MATYCCYSSGNSSDSSNSSQLPEQPLLLSWEYLTPPELEPNGCTSRNPQRPSDVVIRSRRSEFTLKKEEKNAKERNRVKRLNNLYLTLRTILGGECKESKLSKVPVLHAAIKYMKDLASELERLKERKPKMLLPRPPPTLHYYQQSAPDMHMLGESGITTTHQHQIIRQQYSCTCELTLSTNSHSVILDCTEVYDETLNSDGDSPPLVNSVPSNFVSPSTPFQEMTRLYFYSPPMLPQSSSILNTPDVMEEYTELPSTHHPWAISPSPTHGHMHPPPLSHFNYQ